jgi:hypothetical protein
VPYTHKSGQEFGDKENALKDTTALLISTKAASRLLGIDPVTFKGVAEHNGLTPVPTGKTTLWPRLQVERLAAMETENA